MGEGESAGEDIDLATLNGTMRTLLREVDRLRQRLDAAAAGSGKASGEPDEDLSELRQKVAEIEGLVADSQAAVDELTDTVADLGGPSAGGPSVVSWESVDAEQAVIVLAELVDWVEHILKVYAHPVYEALQECWLQHPGAVQTLLDLWAAWCAAYESDTRRIMDAWDIRTRYRRAAIEDLGTEMRRCTTGHKPRNTSLDTDPPTSDQLARIAEAWTSRPRPTGQAFSPDSQ